MNEALRLADGRVLHYEVKASARAKYLRMQLHPSKGLLVTTTAAYQHPPVTPMGQQPTAMDRGYAAQTRTQYAACDNRATTAGTLGVVGDE